MVSQVSHNQKNKIWFSVFPDGSIDECTDTNQIDGDFSLGSDLYLGTKKAYESLVNIHRELNQG
jgi:hypothetical protein